jgi:RIO-like serine/threonine protein kinase
VFTRERYERAEQSELHAIARWANAKVARVSIDGAPWTVKDFAPRSWFVRNVIGRFLIAREMRALRRCAGIRGLPTDAFRIDPFALAYRFVPGRTLRRQRRTSEYFRALEAIVAAIHARRIVHLDLRNAHNILIDEHDQPHVIDFQAHASTRWLPKFVRTALERIDWSGVYKHWERLDAESMDDASRELVRGVQRWRRLWIFRGYFGARARRASKA